MSGAVPVPRRSRPVRRFLIGLGVLLAGVAVFLFAVEMEATATANGLVTARGMVELRAPCDGQVLAEGGRRGSLPQPGDTMAPDRCLLTIAGAEVKTPEDASLWLVAAVHVEKEEGVKAGQRLATLVPLDPQSREPRELLVRLEVHEEHAVEVEVGQSLRVTSNLYNERTNEPLAAVVERVEPLGSVNDQGKRVFTVVAKLEPTERHLLLGSSVKAEILLGRKPVWRIILEH